MFARPVLISARAVRVVVSACTFLVLFGIASGARAQGDLESCFRAAAQKYSLNFYLLTAIGRHESRFVPEAINTANENGSEDLGVMMVNSWWLSKLSEYNITRQRLLDEPCLNIHVGAWILASTLAERGGGWGVGFYNAVTDFKRERYIRLIKEELRVVTHTMGFSGQSMTIRRF
jgi:soluble lytic murein transglycosylase-like protein